MAEDLFETPESVPMEVNDILFKYALLDQTYENCQRLLRDLEYLGYTFDYGLDAIPYDLRKLETN